MVVLDEEKELLDRIRGEWAEMQAAMTEADVVLTRAKAEMKRDLEDRCAPATRPPCCAVLTACARSLSGLTAHMAETTSDFVEHAPFAPPVTETGEIDADTAFHFFSEFRRKLAEHKVKVRRAGGRAGGAWWPEP